MAHKDQGNNKKVAIGNGYPVYRTKNNMLLNSIREKFIDKDVRQGITGLLTAKAGERLKLVLKFDNLSVTAYHNMVEEAKSQPVTAERLKASIDKLGNTLFYFEKLIVDADDNIFVPVAWLNDIRRQAVDLLTEAITGAYRREKTGGDLQSGMEMEDDEPGKLSYRGTPPLNISVGVQKEEQFITAISYGEINAIYADYETFSLKEIALMAESSANAGKKFYVSLPHICRMTVYEKLKKDLVFLAGNEKVEGFIAKNYEEVYLLQSIFKNLGLQKKIRLNHNMYIFNREAKYFWREKGICEFTAPLELNEKELKDLGLSDCELMVYGYLPVMVSAQCLYVNTKGCKKCTPKANTDYLTDRLGMKFYVTSHCGSCYNIIYNGQRLSLIGQAERIADLSPYGIRLDFTFENSKETSEVLSSYTDVFYYGKKVSLDFDNITTGHFKRGVE